VRVLDCSGSGSIGDVVAGMDWVAQHAELPAVAVLSLGVAEGSWSTALKEGVLGLVRAGVSVVVAAGDWAAGTAVVGTRLAVSHMHGVGLPERGRAGCLPAGLCTTTAAGMQGGGNDGGVGGLLERGCAACMPLLPGSTGWRRPPPCCRRREQRHGQLQHRPGECAGGHHGRGQQPAVQVQLPEDAGGRDGGPVQVRRGLRGVGRGELLGSGGSLAVASCASAAGGGTPARA
jgi:hypothetical protein